MAAAETEEAAKMAESNGEASALAALSELTALLSPSSPAAPQAAEAALALSGSSSGCSLLAAHPEALSALASMAASSRPGSAAALSALVNASAEPAALEPLLAALPELAPLLPSSGDACGVAANLSREPRAAPRVLRAMGAGAEPLLRALSAARPPEQLGALVCNLSQAPEGRRVLLERNRLLRALSAARPPEQLGALVCNLSQAPEGRRVLLEQNRAGVRRLLELLRGSGSAELRRGVLGALRNLCFEHEHHEWLLAEEDPSLDVLPVLLLPLAAPEELPEEDMEKVPLELQFLPAQHQREELPEIRTMLLETLTLLAATAPGRAQLRSRGCFLLLRELHSRETEPGVLRACRNLIQVLIAEEPPEEMQNLLEVKIPPEVEEKLQQADREEQEQEGTAR